MDTLLNVPLELNLAVVASRSSLVGALLRTTAASHREFAVDFLRGLSRDELEVLAEFEGARLLESHAAGRQVSPFRLLACFFDPSYCDRWQNPDDRAHKTFVVMAWLERSSAPATSRSNKPAVHA